MKLVIGNKNYSSWSMRPWLLLEHFAIAFDEVPIWFDDPHMAANIRVFAPSGRVPCLIGDDQQPVWDSLAIAETLAERFPQHAFWPRDAAARARARSLSAEMHAGFTQVRSYMPMNVRASWPGRVFTPDVLADVARIDSIWREAMAQSEGPFLCGEFGIVDAMYAPVVMRFNTYQPALSEGAAAYAARVNALPAVRKWVDAARREGHVTARYEL
jgi:glutathione S-transferase